ncbi:MAG: metallophosphoesterase [Prevotella sp.]|nr:metallophosphoesterase [Prevotella sp.]
MRIIHFSDFHFQPNTGIARSQRLAEKLIAALKVIHEEKPIDLIVFSGDMIDKGGNGFDSMDNAFRSFRHLIIDEILNSIGLPSERFVFVCGNHDIERNKDSAIVESGMVAQLKDISTLDDFVRDPSSVSDVKRIEAFNMFRHEYYSSLANAEYYETPFQSNLVLRIDNNTVCISMLNSSWRCWDSKTDKGKILLGQAQVIDSRQYLNNVDIRIAVAHHDYSWMNDFERPNLPRLLVSNYNMFFCGHTHGSDAEMICRPEGNTFIFTAPGLLHANLHELNGNYKNGFMVVDYDKEHLILQATKYQQFDDETFQIDKNYAESGVWERDIPAGELAIMNKQVLEVYDSLFNNVPSLNSHLLGFSTSTKAPKTIEEIFVMPTLTYKERGDNDLNPIKTVVVDSIEKLLSIDGNIILYGAKESGKTILLDQILIEILKNQRNKNLIPAYLEFDSIKTNVLQLIANYWDEKTNVTDKILQEKEVVLLIDNLNFSPDKVEKIKVLVTFLNNYSRVKMIATSLNRNGFSYDDTEIQAFSFKSIKIESFKSEQIRELTCKWNSVPSDTELVRSKMNYILKAFTTFRIPCSPFAVTLLLWILEKGGECQPSNMALLLDGFITELLKDFRGDFTKDKFDQHNKKRLIANIAYGIHREEIESRLQGRDYRFTYSSFIKQIEDHLESMELKMFNAKNIAKELVNVGLFVHDENTSLVYFRFRCFMEYFLAIKMQLTEDFFKFVMEEVNYLDYNNEIVYFTGLTRDKTSVLARILTRLEIVFVDIIQAIDKNNTLDNFFIQSSLIQALGDKDISMLLPEKHNVAKDDKINNEILLNNETKIENGNFRKKRVTEFNVYPQLLLLAMDVLRNTEESEETGFVIELKDGELKSKGKSFDIVVNHSLYYAVATYMIGMRYIYENKGKKEYEKKVSHLSTILFLLPELHEEMLSHHLGSMMLADQMKRMILEQESNQTSELHRFVATFMYADLKAPDYMKYIKRFVQSFKRQYIADAIYLKLMQYYYESDNDNLDKELAELMVIVYTKSHQAGNNKHWNKDVLMKRIMSVKRK